jgi:hypothetical protein
MTSRFTIAGVQGDRARLLSWPAMNARPDLSAASRVLRDMLLLLAVVAALWALHLFGRTLNTLAIATAWGALALVIAAGHFARARTRRRAFLAVYLRADSALAHRLRGGWLMGLRAAATGIVFATVLGVAVLRLDLTAAWIAMIAAALLLPLLRAVTARWLAPQAGEVYLPELSWRVAIPALGVVLTAVLVTIAFHRPYPDFGAIGLESAVWHLVEQETARSEPARLLLEVSAAKDALRLWLAQQLMPDPGVSFVHALGWLIVLAEEVLFVWSYLMLLSAVLIGADLHDRPRLPET